MAYDFLPTTRDEMTARGWDFCDIILITGDAYVDHPAYGAAMIGRALEAAGFRVGIIDQPDWRSIDDFTRLGRPRLFAGVTAGNLDSMVAHYTAQKHRRKDDAYTPGGRTGSRPDRASIVYTGRVREAFPDLPVVLGGVEASLRRLAHYDFWDDTVRRSILLDAKADMLVYGMGEQQVVMIAERLQQGGSLNAMPSIPGTVSVRADRSGLPDYVEIPSFEKVRDDPAAFNRAYALFLRERAPAIGKPIIQKHGSRFVVQMPPPMPLTEQALDAIYDLPFSRIPHPSAAQRGTITGFETVRHAVIALRGCPGECGFCGLGAHQGRIVQSRSASSILREARRIAGTPGFHGTITDIGGPTANLFRARCSRWRAGRPCADRDCLMPRPCPQLRLNYHEAAAVYAAAARIPGVKHVFIGSGFRHDLLTAPNARAYLEAVCARHISGRMKVAPEHTEPSVLRLMNKPPIAIYDAFVRAFRAANSAVGKKQFLVNYFISAHPGAGMAEARALASRCRAMRIIPEQVQDFTPLPMTLSSHLYHTGIHPLSGEKVCVARDPAERAAQRALLQPHTPRQNSRLRIGMDILRGKKRRKKGQGSNL